MGRPNEKEIKAKEFLLEMLKDGEMLSSDCEERLEAAGFKKSTIKKAKKKAGVISRKTRLSVVLVFADGRYTERIKAGCLMSGTVCFYDGGIKRRSRGNTLAHDIFADEV